MNDIGAAILLAQGIAQRACIKKEHAPLGAGIGGFQERGRGQVRHHKRNAAIAKLLERRRRIFVRSERDIGNGELLVQETPGRVVVRDGKLRASQPGVGRRHIEQRNGGLLLSPAQIADLDFGGFSGRRVRRKSEKQTESGKRLQE